ncbi:hypothetical protein LWE61_10145 [Sphingobium sufflavum]|uniref:hypothetical protein n=1 Tax=Sphingobium sufflavum TaxID=1129547 RepID=UPI001F16EF53|nr:hypothetical protein [Sphingobium sufflavum]MCE7796919.1 hypothetical protein [Sphingobium sufflavum]
MGEIVEFPRQREGCARWRRAPGAITLTARPACAALAMALAATTPSKASVDGGGAQPAARLTATVLHIGVARLTH